MKKGRESENSEDRRILCVCEGSPHVILVRKPHLFPNSNKGLSPNQPHKHDQIRCCTYMIYLLMSGSEPRPQTIPPLRTARCRLVPTCTSWKRDRYFPIPRTICTQQRPEKIPTYNPWRETRERTQVRASLLSELGAICDAWTMCSLWLYPVEDGSRSFTILSVQRSKTLVAVWLAQGSERLTMCFH